MDDKTLKNSLSLSGFTYAIICSVLVPSSNSSFFLPAPTSPLTSCACAAFYVSRPLWVIKKSDKRGDGVLFVVVVAVILAVEVVGPVLL